MFHSRFTTRAASALLALAGVIGLAGSAKAGFQIRVQVDGNLPVTVFDSNAAPDGDGSTGGISYINANLNGVAFNISANSNRTLGASIATLDTNILARTVSGTGPHSVIVTTTDDGFNFPGGPTALLNLKSTLSASSLGIPPLSGDFESFVDPGNANYATTISAGLQVIDGAPVSAGQAVRNVAFTRNGNYALTHTFNLTLAANMTSTINITGSNEVASVVPAPAGLILVLTGLPALGLAGRFRRRAAVQA